MKTFEAQSLQLTLTAYCLDRPVLNLWNYSRRPRVLYPAAGLPYWSGTCTRWNTRPCLAALTPIIPLFVRMPVLPVFSRLHHEMFSR